MWDLIAVIYGGLFLIVIIGFPIAAIAMVFGYPLFYILNKIKKEKSLFGDYSDFGEAFGGFYTYISILIMNIFLVVFIYGLNRELF